MNDSLGDRMKMEENIEVGARFIPLLPVIIRLDGRCFSSFTRKMVKPYDERMVRAMVSTATSMVEETNAVIGYTQSDEITLILYSGSFDSQIWFDGRKQKIVSCAASYCSLVFFRNITKEFGGIDMGMPTFDCRAFAVPTAGEAVNQILWREMDATKNSVSSATRAYYSHKDVDGKNSRQKHDMLMAKGINWNDYPAFFKRGSWIQRRMSLQKFTTDEIARLPSKHEARMNPNLVVERMDIKAVDMPPFSTVVNKIEVVFNGADPIVATV